MLNLNATLLGQMITFILFIWVTMKYVWPFVTEAMDERQTKIADGLAAAERGHHELELAQQRSADLVREAKKEATNIVENANRRGSQLVEESKEKAKLEGEKELRLAMDKIDQELNSAKQALRQHVARIAIKGAEKILQRQVDEAANSDIVNKLIEEI